MLYRCLVVGNSLRPRLQIREWRRRFCLPGVLHGSRGCTVFTTGLTGSRGVVLRRALGKRAGGLWGEGGEGCNCEEGSQ